MGITPIEQLKLRTDDYLEAQGRSLSQQILFILRMVLGVMLILAGMFMANYRLNDWLDFPLIFAGIALVFAGRRQGGE